VAQGPIAVSGFSATGAAASITQGVPTDARIPNGAIVEREVAGGLDQLSSLVLELYNPDFKTATLISDTINRAAVAAYGKPVARERDMRSVVLMRPPHVSAARFLAEVGDLLINPDTPAKVVINERTGTVVIGQDVQISTVAMTHGTLTVRVTEMPDVSQPAPFSKGTTTVVPRTAVSTEEPDGHIAVIGGASLQALVSGLNQIGLKPTDIIAILQAIKSAGALQADLVIQ
jgi:flagellar P-ring protein precursor FlgI